MRTRLHALILATTLTQGAALAVEPPPTMNYQGVLRDAANMPRTGTFDMTFRFFDAQSGGSEILVDSHTAGGGSAIAVATGLFNVSLGGGTVADGSGAGTYTSLGEVFRGYTDVWMEIAVGTETLSPRIKIEASAYALNSAGLQGKAASSFLDTSSTSQTKSGTLRVTSASPDAVIGTYYDVTGVLGSGTLGAGVVGSGGDAGGFFNNLWGSQARFAAVAEGVQAVGQLTGASFASNTGSGGATLAAPDHGVSAYGGTYPASTGHFEETVYSGKVDLAKGYDGMIATSSYIAGQFIANVGRYRAEVGNASWQAGGFFDAPLAGVFTVLATDSGYGLASNGPKAFLQNHPTHPGRLIAYTALEGPEAGTYTRGSGSIRGGEARIALDPTFALTTDPEIGLTAVVTPRSPRADLYVASVSTKELVVRSGSASTDEVAFDYVVNGLRVGFEYQPVLLESHTFPSATVPSLEASAARLTAMPEDARGSTPLARLSAERDRSGAGAPELGGARALIAGINSPEHTLHTRASDAGQGPMGRPGGGLLPVVAPSPSTGPDAGGGTSRAGRAGLGAAPVGPRDTTPPSTGGATGDEADVPSSFMMPVGTEVQSGDVLSNDPAAPGSLRFPEEAGDPAVVGVVVGPAGGRFRDQAPIGLAGTVVQCNVDASQRPIAVGDLLVASPTPGLAMSAEADPRRGTVIGKALEPLPAGTGTIPILVMPR